MVKVKMGDMKTGHTAASDPFEGSVRQNAAIHSPVISLGRYLAFCSGVPCNTSPLYPIAYTAHSPNR